MTNLAQGPGQSANKSATRDIVVEDVLPYSPERVWKALTTAELIGKWLMPNDFEPWVGKRFTFKSRPIGEWFGGRRDRRPAPSGPVLPASSKRRRSGPSPWRRRARA